MNKTESSQTCHPWIYRIDRNCLRIIFKCTSLLFVLLRNYYVQQERCNLRIWLFDSQIAFVHPLTFIAVRIQSYSNSAYTTCILCNVLGLKNKITDDYVLKSYLKFGGQRAHYTKKRSKLPESCINVTRNMYRVD